MSTAPTESEESAMNHNLNHGSSHKEKRMNAITKAMSVAVLVALGLPMIAWTAEPVTRNSTVKSQTILLDGPGRWYRVSFEDGTNPAVEKTGEELANGLAVTLKGAPVSELVWIEETRK